MKNITFYCVHCAKLLEFKQEYANQTATCPFCKKSITVPEFNSVEVEAEAAPENSVKQRFSSAYCIGGWTEIAIPFLKFMSVLTGIFTISGVIAMTIITIVTKSGNLYWSPILIVVGLLAFYVFYIVNPLDNPNKKIINSTIKKTALILWIILCMVLAVILITRVFGNTTILDDIRCLLSILILHPATAISTILAFRLYKIRAKEDACFAKEEIAADERKKSKYRSSAIYYTFASFILPLFGLFTLGAFIDIYKAQKEEQQENMGKIIFIAILSGIYNIPYIMMLLSCLVS